MVVKLTRNDQFYKRHIGPNEKERQEMLQTIGVKSMDQLIDETVPRDILLKNPLNLPPAFSEAEYLADIQKIAQKNKVYKSYIGLGYYDTITPAVIQRMIFENPGWYTQYTPYQAEISQGRLQAILNYQTMIIDLTGMEVANASLLDEGTAAAEAMTMLFRLRGKKMKKSDAKKFFVSNNVFQHTIDVLKTRSAPLGIELVIGDPAEVKFDDSIYGALIQYPSEDGEIIEISDFINKAHENETLVAVAADIMSLVLLKSPGELGADVVFGNSQRFGVPMGYGGPHAAFFATRDDYKRQIPGRIIGVSVDRYGRNALRMALQTREQHIRGDKATSNICTAQALLAIMAGAYAVYHGPNGIRAIATEIHRKTVHLENQLAKLGVQQLNKVYFDTLKISADADMQEKIKVISLENEINFRYDDGFIGISVDETTELADLENIFNIFCTVMGKPCDAFESDVPKFEELNILSKNIVRMDEILTHPVFNSYHSETKMMRYLKHLENQDLSLTTSMIPLGSCTMKLNPAAAMLPVTWPEFSKLHPFIPTVQAEGYYQIINELEQYLCEITGFEAATLQPNSGAAGEYTGLMVIRAYHLSRGDEQRKVTLIPLSAHGTNPASAVMAGTDVVTVKCTDTGDVDLVDLKEKAEKYKDTLSAFMITYPSTHGVFEAAIRDMCNIIHENGGLVYMDGANMNAQVGLTSPGEIGADVCHLNLHKTFAIPHGGGGPGVGPICVSEKLAQFLPTHSYVPTSGENAINAVASAPFGSASVLLISYAYIKMLGTFGLVETTKNAILNANYLKARLEKYFPAYYTGKNNRVGHELIFDLQWLKEIGVEVEDVAKRLMDYGFHSPTMSWPVHGTLMAEPTESESKDELDRFSDAMISIYNEIMEVKAGQADKDDNVLKNAPHMVNEVTSNEWSHPYSREKAAFPLDYVKEYKFWPSAGRVDNTYGDRNLVCSCLPIEAYAEK